MNIAEKTEVATLGLMLAQERQKRLLAQRRLETITKWHDDEKERNAVLLEERENYKRENEALEDERDRLLMTNKLLGDDIDDLKEKLKKKRWRRK